MSEYYCLDCKGMTACWCDKDEANLQSKQAERKELFKQVALKTIAYSPMTKWDIDLDIAEAMTEAILSAAETFSKENK